MNLIKIVIGTREIIVGDARDILAWSKAGIVEEKIKALLKRAIELTIEEFKK